MKNFCVSRNYHLEYELHATNGAREPVRCCFYGYVLATWSPEEIRSVIRFLHAKCVSPLKFTAISQRGSHIETGECQKMVSGFLNSSKGYL